MANRKRAVGPNSDKRGVCGLDRQAGWLTCRNRSGGQPLVALAAPGLTDAGPDVVLRETRRVKGALKAMLINPGSAMLRVLRACCTWVGPVRSRANLSQLMKVVPFSALAGPPGRA